MNHGTGPLPLPFCRERTVGLFAWWEAPHQSCGNNRNRGISLQKLVVRVLRAFAPAVMGIAAAGTSWAADGAADTRTLSFYNVNTKENVTITFKKDGEYLSEGLTQINQIMRDWRRDATTRMDPKLIDIIWEIYREVGATEPIKLISGYRSRRTNERLRRRGGGQARNSSVF